MQAFHLGELLHERYIDKTNFLPRAYSPLAIQCQSTELDRTIMTAQAVMSGLYGSNENLV